MQPQDNSFPVNQPQGDDQASGMPIQPASQPLDPQNPLSGGTTIQPQAGGVSASAPTWHNDAVNDANQLYAQPAPSSPAMPQENTQATTPPLPENPLHQDTELAATPTTAPGGLVVPSEAMAADFQNSNLAAQPVASPIEQTPPPTPVSNEPIVPSAEAVQTPQAEMPQQPVATPNEPIMPASPNQSMNDPYAQPAAQPTQAGLPGSENLGSAVASLYQPEQPGAMPGQDMQQYPTDGSPMGSYGPPPKKSKTMVFVIIGVVLGIIAISVGVALFLRSRNTSQQINTTPNNSSQNQQTSDNQTPPPASGPATPPAGYATIQKQCYSFALIEPNTVPTDSSCSFSDSTFGKLEVSKISVTTTTEAFKTIDEYTALFEPTVTVVEKNDVTLDGLTGKQIIYKATDGKTYSQVALLIVGKNYQQEGKPVTGLALTTSYQDSFDKEVTPNVISTWRWQ